MIDFDLRNNPLSLHLCQILIVSEVLFFGQVSADDNALKDIQYELPSNEDKSYEVNLCGLVTVSLRDIVNFCGISAFKHHLVPALSS